jgi:hypothetical protein
VSDLVERVARKMFPSLWGLKDYRARGGQTVFSSGGFIEEQCEMTMGQVRIGLCMVLAELSDPSDDVVRAAKGFEFTYPMDDYNSEISLYSREQVEGLLAVILDAFARENGLEPTP